MTNPSSVVDAFSFWSVVWQRFSGFIKWVFSLYIRHIKTLNHQIHPVQSFYKPMSSCFGFGKEGLPMAKMLRWRNHRNQKASCQSLVWQRFSEFIKCCWLFFCPDQPLKHQIHPVQSFYKPIWWFCCSFLGCDVIKGVLNLRETLGILESSSMFKNFPDLSKAIRSL